MYLSPECAICNERSALIEIISPGELPRHISNWAAERRELYMKWVELDSWRMRYSGPGGSSGDGGIELSAEDARAVIEVFTPPIDFNRVGEIKIYDHAGICMECHLPYCTDHWSISRSGFGHCPEGHGQSLDPYWTSDFD